MELFVGFKRPSHKYVRNDAYRLACRERVTKVGAVVSLAERIKERGEKQWAGSGPRSDHFLRSMGGISPHPHIVVAEHIAQEMDRLIGPAVEEAKQCCRLCIHATVPEVIWFTCSEVHEASER